MDRYQSPLREGKVQCGQTACVTFPRRNAQLIAVRGAFRKHTSLVRPESNWTRCCAGSAWQTRGHRSWACRCGRRRPCPLPLAAPCRPRPPSHPDLPRRRRATRPRRSPPVRVPAALQSALTAPILATYCADSPGWPCSPTCRQGGASGRPESAARQQAVPGAAAPSVGADRSGATVLRVPPGVGGPARAAAAVRPAAAVCVRARILLLTTPTEPHPRRRIPANAPGQTLMGTLPRSRPALEM